MGGGTDEERTDWWAELEPLPRPIVLVIEDLDQRPGAGAFVGEGHAHILKAFGSVSVETDGAVRALHAIEPLGIQVYSGTVSPAHAYIHVVHFETAVKVAGLLIRQGICSMVISTASFAFLRVGRAACRRRRRGIPEPRHFARAIGEDAPRADIEARASASES
jgi:hypothetical protein